VTKKALAALALAAGLSACGGKPGSGSSSAEPPAPAGTPVVVAAVVRENIARTVSAPGQTAALSQQKVRAPFTGTLSALSVTDGDRVRRGQTLGAIVSRDSEAALSGAREMVREAGTAAEARDAKRALELAEKALVRAPLVSPVDGQVLSHAANGGDRVSEDQEILTIADAGSIVFEAQMPQTELPSVRRGERAEVKLAGRNEPVPGTVHDVLPSANAADLTAPVRIDLGAAGKGLGLGLFGTATITVGVHEGATAVPAAAVIENDVTGSSRIALVAPDGKAHWVAVTPGWKQGGLVEIASPGLTAGQKVIVSGQVGLPEGAPVTVEK
jgi:Cu(I)/Ag(I) efflux system membrane fusion protein